MSKNTWNSEKDFIDDMCSLTENQVCGDYDPPPPPTIQAWNARMANNRNNSIYDTYIPENIVISGRGRGGAHIFLTPGSDSPGFYDSSNDEDIRKRIRASAGFGYSNEFIKQMAKCEAARLEAEGGGASTIANDAIRLRPTALTTGSVRSSSGSRSSSPASKKPNSSSSCTSSPRKSTTSSPATVHVDENRLRTASSSESVCSSSDASAVNVELSSLRLSDRSADASPEIGPVRPLPLSTMLKNAKTRHVLGNNNFVEDAPVPVINKKHSWGSAPRNGTAVAHPQKKEVKHFWGTKPSTTVHTLDINSAEEFPPLK